MKLVEVTDYKLKSQQILNESWTTLTESQRMYVGRWERELWPLLEQYTKLCEATLTAAQIQQIFQSAEDTAMASGTNTSALGKVGAGAVAAAKLPIDLAKQVNAKIDELGRMAQKAGPIQNADQKFDQLKKDILAKNSDSVIVQGIQKVSDWAKENPGKASLAVGILTTLAAFAGGPLGGAAAGLIFRATKDLLQGEKLSTAVGKSVKTAALGFVTGKAFEELGKVFAGMRMDSLPIPGAEASGLEEITFRATRRLSEFGKELKQTLQGFEMVGFPGEIQAMDAAIAAIQRGEIGAFDALKAIADEVNSASYQSAITDILGAARMDQLDNDSLLQWIKDTAQAAQAIGQGAAQASDDKKESVSMEDKYDQYLQEGPLDAVKRGAAKVGGAIKSKAAAVGKELGNKVTVTKLMKQWKAMGEPTDTGSIMNILQGAGVSDEQIGQIGQTTKIELEPSAQPTGDAPAVAQPTGPVAGDVDLKLLADEIKKAGSAVIAAVKAMLSKTQQQTPSRA